MRRFFIGSLVAVFVVVVTLLACGTWVPHDEDQVRRGIEYQVIRGEWQWHSREAILRSVTLIGGFALLLIGVMWWAPVPLSGSSAPPASRPMTPVERRRFPRIPCSWPVRYHVRGLPFERQATCVNISMIGIQCLMHERWVQNTPLELSVHPPNAEPLQFSGTVVWSRGAARQRISSTETPLHYIGICFQTPPVKAREALQHLLVAENSKPAAA